MKHVPWALVLAGICLLVFASFYLGFLLGRAIPWRGISTAIGILMVPFWLLALLFSFVDPSGIGFVTLWPCALFLGLSVGLIGERHPPPKDSAAPPDSSRSSP